METTLDKFGRIVIPKKIRNNLGLMPGVIIKIEVSGEELVLKPLIEEPHVKIKDGVMVFTGVATEEIEMEVRKFRENRRNNLADKLLTFNIKDFKRVWPDGAAQIISP